jgi:hypothetical protein
MTFDQWISNPQGKGSAVMSNRVMYHKMYSTQWDNLRLRENGLIMYHLYKDDKDFYIHFKIPSEINTNFYYDTVIRFYPPNSDRSVSLEKTLKNYEFQCYSNDPSFVYTFAYAYKSHKLLINDLYDKMSPLALKQPAKVKNPRNEIGYVKSVYFAYLEIKHLDLFTKVRWETTASKYSKNVWKTTVEHADDKIRKAQELSSANAKTKKKAEDKEKRDNKEFEKKSTSNKFKSPNISNFGHFKSDPIGQFKKSIKTTIDSHLKSTKHGRGKK